MRRKIVWLPAIILMIGSCYAASDEIHQLFVSGRAGMISDVLIDSVGVLVGWGVFVVLMKKIWKWRHGRTK